MDERGRTAVYRCIGVSSTHQHREARGNCKVLSSETTEHREFVNLDAPVNSALNAELLTSHEIRIPLPQFPIQTNFSQ